MSTKDPGPNIEASNNGTTPEEYPYPQAVECPYPYYDRIRAESPVHKIPGQESYFIALRDDVVYAFDHPKIFSNKNRNPRIPIEARVMKSGIEVRTTLDSDPPEQEQHKRFVLKHFNAKLFRDNAAAIRKIVDSLIDGFIEDGKCEFKNQFADRLPELAICHLLALPPDVNEKITAWGRLETSGVRFFSGERKELQERVLKDLESYANRTVLERHKNLGNDVLSNLIRAQIERDGQFEPDYTSLTLQVLITAGLLTTALMLANGIYLLLTHPEQMERVVNDFSLIPNMVEEIIRIETPAQWIPKRVAQNFEHGVRDAVRVA